MNNNAMCEALMIYFTNKGIITNVNYDSVQLTIEVLLFYDSQHPMYITANEQLQTVIKNIQSTILYDLQENFGLYCHDVNITNTAMLDYVNSSIQYGVFLSEAKAAVHKIAINFYCYIEQKEMDLLYALFKIKGLI